jgi:hypothetical protein
MLEICSFSLIKNYFVGRRDVGCDRMATPLGTLGLSFVFCLIIAILFVCCIYLFIFPAFTALACILVYVTMHHVDSTHFAT